MMKKYYYQIVDAETSMNKDGHPVTWWTANIKMHRRFWFSKFIESLEDTDLEKLHEICRQKVAELNGEKYEPFSY